MATNSILKNIRIKDKLSAKKLAAALENSKAASENIVIFNKKCSEATKEEIRDIFKPDSDG